MRDNPINSRINTPNERLRFLRALTRLTRKVIAEKYDLPEVTLNKWETGTLSLSDKGITKCINIYKNEGVVSTEEWIKFGNGPFPYILDNPDKLVHQGKYQNFANDIDYFKKTYSDCIFFEVVGDEMLPIYKPDDLVIGYRNLNNKFCIVTLENNSILLRKLVVSSNSKYNLHCINPLTTSNEPILFDINILQIAPVIWHGIVEDRM
jgi:phage repressor protein C with HTH and peptisase S24 domain